MMDLRHFEYSRGMGSLYDFFLCFLAILKTHVGIFFEREQQRFSAVVVSCHCGIIIFSVFNVSFDCHGYTFL